MIPLWLTPKVIKGSILGIIVMSIFFTGFYARGKLSAAKIVRLKTEIATLNSNYDLCWESLQRSNDNLLGLKDAVDKTNLEVIRQGEEYNARVIELKKLSDEAINRANASYDAEISSMIAETDRLRRVMQTMSSAEACHLAMTEIVK